MRKLQKLFLALGPGDIVGARRAALSGLPIAETSLAYSEQILNYCRLRQFRVLAISSNPRIDQFDDGQVRLENRPKPFRGRGGVNFHLSQVLYAAMLALRARQFGATIAIADSGTTHYFCLALFRLLGIRVVVNLHNVLWPSGYPPTRPLGRAIRKLDALFFRYVAAAALGVSPECERQVRQQANDCIPFYQYRCQFARDGFRVSQRYQGGTFRIAFVGCAERNNGLLDLVEIAKRLRTHATRRFIIDVCGDGPALPELKARIEAEQLSYTLVVHGRLGRARLLEIYGAAHALIVPTRSDFTEGMPAVCAEAVLSGLPVVTSPVTNASEVIGAATIQAVTDDIDSYVRAILSLADDSALYDRLRDACEPLSRQFLDRSQSFPAAVDRMLAELTQSRCLDSYDALFLDGAKVTARVGARQ